MEFLKFGDAGLEVLSRADIYKQLKNFAKIAYGNDFVIGEGTPFDVYLQLLADTLSSVNGSVQSFSELYSVKELSGNFLDFAVGLRGVVRKRKSNQKVTFLVTVNEEVERPFILQSGTLYVKDESGREWVNTTQLVVHEYKFKHSGPDLTDPNYQGTCEFGLLPLDGYTTDILEANEELVVSNRTHVEIREAIESIENKFNAKPPIFTTETDAQLRARFDNAVYGGSIATVEGLRTQLLKVVDYVDIIENQTNSDDVNANTNPYGLEGHSIWVIVGGGSNTEKENVTDVTISDDVNDVEVAQTILNYKSLGCGVSVDESVSGGTISINGEELYTGNFMVEFPVETITVQIPFTRVVLNAVDFTITLDTSSSDGDMKESVRERVADVVIDYVDSLGVGEVITTSALVASINSVLSQYGVGEFDFDSYSASYDIGSKIEVYQRAVAGSISVNYVGE